MPFDVNTIRTLDYDLTDLDSVDEVKGRLQKTIESFAYTDSSEELDMEDYQGNAVVNYTEREVPFTRIIEHKHFEFGKQPTTVISREYSAEWKPGLEPYYPVNDDRNTALYARYKELADKEEHVIFGGRLAEYKYYDMAPIVEKVLKMDF